MSTRHWYTIIFLLSFLHPALSSVTTSPFSFLEHHTYTLTRTHLVVIWNSVVLITRDVDSVLTSFIPYSFRSFFTHIQFCNFRYKPFNWTYQVLVHSTSIPASIAQTVLPLNTTRNLPSTLRSHVMRAHFNLAPYYDHANALWPCKCTFIPTCAPSSLRAPEVRIHLYKW